MKYLLLGCGTTPFRCISVGDEDRPVDFSDGTITTVDNTTGVNPDFLADLSDLPYDYLESGAYDEIHAYAILEHTGTQGDGDFFFGQFNECWRVLKDNGVMLITVPMWNHQCQWGVPDHKRALPSCVFGFLQEDYYDNLGKPGYADYRHLLKGCYWKVIYSEEKGELLYLAIQKCQPR